MNKIIKLHNNADYAKIKHLDDPNLIIIFMGTDDLPARKQIPCRSYWMTERGVVQYTPLDKSADFFDPVMQARVIYNYVQIQSVPEEIKYLILRDDCMLFDTEFLRNYTTAHLDARLIYEFNPHTARKENNFYIRPEDLDLYNGIITSIVFSDVAALNIYAEHNYPLDLNILMNFNNSIKKVNNAMIDPKFARKRLTCKGRCWKGSNCQTCSRELASAALVEEYLKK